MGYIATRLATTFAAADNVAYYDTAQRISALDALAPNGIVKWLLPEVDKTRDVDAEHKHDRLFKITTDAKGRRSFVVRKSKNAEQQHKQQIAKDNNKGKIKAANKDIKKPGNPQADQKKGKDDAKPVADDNRGKDFTAEEDGKLKSMKADNKTWKDIMEALGRGKSELQARFKQLQNAGADGKKDEFKSNKQANDQKPDEQKAKQKNKQGKAEKAQKISEMVNSDEDEARFTLEEWKTLQEDDLFTLSELQFLSEIIVKEGIGDWLKISSVFYDNTGRRVHPDDIRDKFAQLNVMLDRSRR